MIREIGHSHADGKQDGSFCLFWDPLLPSFCAC